MGREYFVTKLMAGKADASAKTRWWPRHCRAMGRYLLLASDRDGAALKSVRELMAMGCTEWESTVCRSSGRNLMAEHAKLETALVDAAMRVQVAEMEKIGAQLVANAKGQTDLYAALIPEFPAARWTGLFARHINLFVDSIHSRIKPDERMFTECEERRRENTLALAAFTAEWL